MSAPATFVLRAGPFDLTGKTVIAGTNTCRVQAGADGFEFGQVTAEERSRSTSLRDGGIATDGPFGNRVAEFPVQFSATNSVDLARGIAAVWRWCAEPDTYTWQHPDGVGVVTTFQAVRAWLEGQSTAADIGRTTEILTLSIQCLPFGRSPQKRTSPTYQAAGAVQQVPVVGSARTSASVEVFMNDDTGTSGLRFRKIIVLSHPSLASGFKPLLVPVNSTGVYRLPLSSLPTGTFMLLGPSTPPPGTTKLTVRAGVYRGDPGNGGVLVRDSRIVSDRAPAGDVYGVMQLPEPRLGREVTDGWLELTLGYQGDDPSVGSGVANYYANFFLIPLDEDAALTTMVGGTIRNVIGAGLSVAAQRVWLDTATLERPTDEAWEGVAADRSDSVAAGQLTRWQPPEFRPRAASQTSSMMVWVEGSAGNPGLASWRVTYWPMWHGMAPE